MIKRDDIDCHAAIFKLFVYGTLKRDFWNHNAYCRNALSIQNASLRGRLYQFSSGIPVLMIPEDDIIAYGTYDYANDALIAANSADEAYERASMPADKKWRDIKGELVFFDNLKTNIPPIDTLEGYIPNQPDMSMYKRVLIPVTSGSDIFAAWCYVMDKENADILKYIDSDCWVG